MCCIHYVQQVTLLVVFSLVSFYVYFLSELYSWNLLMVMLITFPPHLTFPHFSLSLSLHDFASS